MVSNALTSCLREMIDGRPHRIVATYDSFAGRKAVYIDGRRRFSHDFAVGNLILNGGPAPTEIGNFSNLEPFTGTIDEVAYCDFALLLDEVSTHHQRALRGESYFEQNSGPAELGRWRAITLVSVGEPQFFNPLTGLVIPKTE